MEKVLPNVKGFSNGISNYNVRLSYEISQKIHVHDFSCGNL